MNAIDLSDGAIRKKLLAPERQPAPPKRAAVLLPLIEKEDGLHILFEVRSAHLKHQPGEVCFPGGAVESGESPEEAAIRETVEELLISPEQVTLLGPLSVFPSARGQAVHAFVGRLTGYEGSFSADETERVFTLPLSWFFEHPAVHYPASRMAHPDGEFPYELIPNGRNYAWGTQHYTIPVYHGSSDPVIWGLTARLTDEFCRLFQPEALAQEQTYAPRNTNSK